MYILWLVYHGKRDYNPVNWNFIACHVVGGFTMDECIAVCGKIVDATKTLDGYCVALDPTRGVISRVAKKTDLHNCKVKDYSSKGYLLMPGLVDLHVHLRGLELSYKEDERTGSQAALSSGVTLVVDMPNTRPRVDNLGALNLKLEALKSDFVELIPLQ